MSQNNFHARILFPANYLSMHIEIAQHINGDSYGQIKILIYLQQSCLPVNNSTLVKKLHGQSQFSCIKLRCFFRESPIPFAH
jgi:hypothetical protein